MLRGSGRRHDSVEPACPRLPGAETRSPELGDTVRAQTDDYGQKLYYRSEDFTVAERAQQIAARRGVSASQIGLAWILSKPYVTAPIIGASKMKHLEENIAALDITLSADDVKLLEEPYLPHPILGHA